MFKYGHGPRNKWRTLVLRYMKICMGVWPHEGRGSDAGDTSSKALSGLRNDRTQRGRKNAEIARARKQSPFFPSLSLLPWFRLFSLFSFLFPCLLRAVDG